MTSETDQSFHFDGIPGNAFDEQRRRLVSPPDWVNPKPSGRYHLVVIGAGTAGLVTAAGAAGLGAKVALIERNAMGGDCLNVGCVPSKAILASARRARICRESSSWGVRSEQVQVDFSALMQRMRGLRADISPHDSVERFRELGVDVFLGSGKFTSGSEIEVDGQTRLSFRKAVICTGARARVPDIPGLSDVGFRTNESIFSLTELPKRLLVLGGGPIGCELAQAFAQFGSQVTMVHQGASVLANHNRDAAEIVAHRMKLDGITMVADGRLVSCEREGSRRVAVVMKNGQETRVEFDELLIAVGRTPNVDGLGLEAAGVEYDRSSGVRIDSRLRTSNKRVFAAGDICSRFQFTHAADFQARAVIRNALFLGRVNHETLLIPRCTYTTPEVASVGLSVQEAQERAIATSVFELPWSKIDRAIVEAETEGFVRVVCRKGSDRILGATIVAENAGDLIAVITLAMNRKIGLSKIGSVIQCYPTRAEAIRKLGDLYSKTRLTPTVKTLFDLWLKWTR